MNQKLESFNPLKLLIRGECLIEASAGTGKTFTIVLLYLRLLLGLGDKNAHVRPLSVKEILVVTFTEAATLELRNRINTNIRALRVSCIRGYSDNKMLMALLGDIKNPINAIMLLLTAERQIDEAAIFTIHGFCHRMLKFNAFECGILFEHQLIEDESSLLKQATADFWKQYFYPLKRDIAQIIINEWSGPEQLLNTLQPLLNDSSINLNIFPDRRETLISHHQKNLLYIAEIKKSWLRVPEETIISIINHSGINKRSYNSKYLNLWINNISRWAKSETENYYVPCELARFGQRILQEKTKTKSPPYHPLFVEIDNFSHKKVSLRDLIIVKALNYIRNTVKKEKILNSILSFNDLLGNLDKALLKNHTGRVLAHTIRELFPVALIDEFQDTDPQQYRIFRNIYINNHNSALLLIGDPKQAIYSFRGANISTYIQARNEIKRQYTLDTNWRSSPTMVNAINQIFSRINLPFIFDTIPFTLSNVATENQNLTFNLNGKPYIALRFWLQPSNGCNLTNYQQYMAQQCAANINYWLQAAQQNRAVIGDASKLRPMKASDIAILVRNRNEATLMQNALNKFCIPSFYFSNYESVYTTLEAQELLWILKGILSPERKYILRTALATSLFSFNSAQIDELNHNSLCWNKIVDSFNGWRLLWKQSGILAMLRQIMLERNLTENLLTSENGKRRLTNLMHLGELLQTVSAEIFNPHALIRYLSKQISNPNNQSIAQQIRLENDHHLVQILTIHKSKGLQYPLVWLPFISGFRESKISLCDNIKHNKIFNSHYKKERLAEDLRLLYVALTRSIYHCSIGIAPLFFNARKKDGETDLHNSALGYLLQYGKPSTAKQLKVILEEINKNEVIDVISNDIANNESLTSKIENHANENMLFCARIVKRQLVDSWQVTSYTNLKCNNSNISNIICNFDLDAVGEQNFIRWKKNNNNKLLTSHSFPCGAGPGTFLHELFKSLDFTQFVSKDKLEQFLQQSDYPLHWKFMLQRWITCILNKPLNMHGITLSQISNRNKLVELSFYMPINNLIKSEELNSIIRNNDFLSADAPDLHFSEMTGMLKGFIDLIFKWKDKYYLLDYKSNWLGNNTNCYSNKIMSQVIIKHRYDLQYQLYTLALHRYLKNRLINYDYEKNFGGVFYLFLRGIDDSISENGIFYTRLKYNFVLQLDEFFMNKT